VARSLGLDSKQQKRMDDVFGGNRDNLVKLYKNLQHEESELEKMSRSRELDENQIFQQIDRVTLARGEAEKAYAHMLLQLRKELTPDQTSRLNDLLPAASSQ
jgi:Spy/CpxP family protein refolding chaperone